MRQLSELMGGSVSATSQVGVGSTFRFELTLPIASSLPMLKSDYKRLFADLSVLIVDDNPISLRSLTQIVQGFDCDFRVALSGEDAIEKFETALKSETPFDVVLMDQRLPGINGIKAAEIMRKMRPNADDCIIILETAHGAEMMLHAPDSGEVNALLIKPVTPSTLFDTLIEFKNTKEYVDSDVKDEAVGYTNRVLVSHRIFLAEDNPLNQNVATMILEGAGCKVVPVNDGAQALDILMRDNRFDVILMDMQMPVMDGLTGARKIRAIPELDKVPIIALTANASDDDRCRCLEAGMDEYSAKPFKPEQLVLVIKKLGGRD